MQTNLPISVLPTANDIMSGAKSKLISTFMNQFIKQEFIEKIINITVYGLDFSISVSPTTINPASFIKKFLVDCYDDINKMKTLNFEYPVNVIKNTLKFAKDVLESKQSVGYRLVNYDNLQTHFPNADLQLKKIIENVKRTRINNMTEYQTEFDIITQTIQAFNELREFKTFLNGIDYLVEQSEKTDVPLMGQLKEFKEVIVSTYNAMSNLQIINKAETLSDYVIISDKQSCATVATSLTEYLSSGYSFYKTGYKLIDDNIKGLESANIHLIAGASNHGKSIFMINLFKNMIIHNMNTFQPNDTFIFITLEDDIRKVLRRFLSIFGVIQYGKIADLFEQSSNLFKKQNSIDIKEKNPLSNEINNILRELLEEAILSITGSRVNILIKHSNENTFSPADAFRLIDEQALLGRNVKALFIDYLNMMVPSNSRYSAYDDYSAHGLILQELRAGSRRYCIPVVTITQNNREAENTTQNMSNGLIGDSYRKIQYADYVYMIRNKPDKDLLSADVKSDVLVDPNTPIDLNDIASNSLDGVIPFEVKITKAKDGKKDVTKFHLFDTRTLRIYDMLDHLISDSSIYQQRTNMLSNRIELLQSSLMYGSPSLIADNSLI